MTTSQFKAMMKPVPTKKHDGGSNKAKRNKSKHFDAFSYYSDNAVRMNALLGRQERNRQTPQSNDGEENARGTKQPCRQTRLSFELDPTYIIMEALFAMADEEPSPST